MVEINEKNEDIYQKFVDIKRNRCHDMRLLKQLIISIILLLVIFTAEVVITNIITITNKFILITIPTCKIILPVVFIEVASKVNKKKRLEEFKEQNPDFDMSIDIKELEDTLDKYKEQQDKKNIAEAINVNEKQVFEIYKNMSTEEKIKYLGKEKELLKQQIDIEEEIKETKVKNFGALK